MFELNEIDDARCEIAAAIYLVGAALADSVYLTVIFSCMALLYFILILNDARKSK